MAYEDDETAQTSQPDPNQTMQTTAAPAAGGGTGHQQKRGSSMGFPGWQNRWGGQGPRGGGQAPAAGGAPAAQGAGGGPQQAQAPWHLMGWGGQGQPGQQAGPAGQAGFDPWQHLQQRVGGFRDARDRFRTGLRDRANERVDGLAQRFGMEPGFASRLPWNRGMGGPNAVGGSVEPAPDPATPQSAPSPAPQPFQWQPPWRR